MAINYSNVKDIINIQYQDRKLKDGSMSLNSLYQKVIYKVLTLRRKNADPDKRCCF